MRAFRIIVLFGLLLPLAQSQVPPPPYVPGQTYWGTSQYVEYIAGSGAIVLSSPHGGYLKPPSIPDRTYGVTGQDLRTQETARALADEIAAYTGRRPHLIISHLHRIKLDPNREIVEAAQGDPQAEQAWHDFHDFIDNAETVVESQWGRGFYIDVHGHGHPEGWVELGYTLSASTLALSDPLINTTSIINSSSIRAIAINPGVYFPGILRGSLSLGGQLQTAGYNSVPSPVNPDPAGGNYFNGGYNTKQHGSRYGGYVDGVQIELPYSIRQTAASRGAFVQTLAPSIDALFTTFYNMDIAADPKITIQAVDPVASETGGVGKFAVTRTGNLSSPVSVNVLISGTATSGQDYSSLGSVLTIPAWQDTVVFSIDPLDDTLAEGDETVTLTLYGGQEIGVANQASVIIMDDEGAPHHLAHLDFEEASGSTAFDATGNGHFGLLHPSAGTGPQRVPGNTGNALQFDEFNDYVRISDFPYSPSGAFTVSFWFNTTPSGGSSWQYLLSHSATGQPDSLNIYFSETTGLLRTRLAYANNLASDVVLDVTDDYRDGLWHHYALTSAPGERSRVYIDGQSVAVTFQAGNTLDPTGDIYIGARQDLDLSRYYGGLLDELRFHDLALTDAEVRILHEGYGPLASVYPGSQGDLVLLTGVNAPLSGGAGHDVETAAQGDILNLQYFSPGGTLDNTPAALVVQAFPTGQPPVPLAPDLHFDLVGGFILLGPALLPPTTGVSFGVQVPNLAGLSVLLQALAIPPSPGPTPYVATDAHEIRFL